MPSSGVGTGTGSSRRPQAGYRDLLDWVAGHGPIQAMGVESTGSYGAGLTRHLLAEGIEVYEVNRPEKAPGSRPASPTRSTPTPQPSRSSLAARAPDPKIKTGIVEAIRAVKIPRDSAVKERTRAYGQIRDLVTTAPTVIHDALIGATARRRVAVAAAYRPDLGRLEDPLQATKLALRTLARRVQHLDTEIAAADKTADRRSRSTLSLAGLRDRTSSILNRGLGQRTRLRYPDGFWVRKYRSHRASISKPGSPAMKSHTASIGPGPKSGAAGWPLTLVSSTIR